MKIKILSITELRCHENGIISTFSGVKHVILDDKLCIIYTCDGKLERIYVPIGFETDFGSIPKFGSWLVHPKGSGARAYVIHDWLCFSGFDRKKSDMIMRAALIHLHVRSWEAWIAYIAVRIFNPLYERFISDKRKVKKLSMNQYLVDKKK